MDTARGFDDRTNSDGPDYSAGEVSDVAIDVGGDERRMHVRAYNHWVSLLQGRAYPAIEDLDPESIADFGAHSVLLDFSAGIENPRIQFLGRTLREECGIDHGVTHVAEVPSRSLLSRLTDHYLQIIANRAPIGFEAEFVGTRGHNTLYRGILMPFSSDEDSIDFIYGVINWKELVDAETQARLNADLAAARRVPTPAPTTAVWADGPGAGSADGDAGPAAVDTDAGTAAAQSDEPGVEIPVSASLDEQLAAARQSAAAFAASEHRSHAALYRTLGCAYRFVNAAAGNPEGYAAILAEAGIVIQARAPMTAVAKLVFGADYDKTRLTEFASVLVHAARHGVGIDGLPAYLEAFKGGIKGIVGAERALRRPRTKANPYAAVVAELRDRPALARIDIAHNHADGAFVVLLARAGALGTLEVLGYVKDDKALTERTVRRIAA